MHTVADEIIECATGEMGMGTYTGDPLAPTHGEIARLAYSLYEARGRQHGHELEDWLHAERELVHHYS